MSWERLRDRKPDLYRKITAIAQIYDARGERTRQIRLYPAAMLDCRDLGLKTWDSHELVEHEEA